MRRRFGLGRAERRLIGSYGALLPAGPVAEAAPPAVNTPASIMGADCVEWWRADLGNTIAADGNWVGQVGGVTFAQGTGAARPTQSASGGPNSQPMMTFDGSDDFISCALVRAAPATTPSVVWMVMRQVSWTSNDAIINDNAGAFAMLQRTASPQIAMSNVTIVNNNAGMTIGTWGRLQAYFSGSTSDEILAIATASTGASAGNTAGTGPRIGTNSGGTTFGNFELAEYALFKAKPDAGQKTLLDAYVTERYGAGLV